MVGLVALAVRAAPLLVPGVLTSVREYDSGVMYTGSLALASGQLPYRDFVFLHPPGALLALLPFAAVGRVGDDALGLGLARLAVVAIGAVNAMLVAWLLRRRGVAAMLAGGLGYALWAAVVPAEQTVLLEPALNLGLLVALACVASGRRGAVTWAGVALGLACAVKYWAAVDVVLLLAVVGCRFGRRAAWRFLAGAAVGAAVVVLPFFARAPGQMWRQTVLTQLHRPVAAVGIDERGRLFSPLVRFAAVDGVLPGVVWLGALAVVVVLGLVPMVVAWARREHPRDWPDVGRWAVIAAVHLVVLCVSASFYYHYAAWAAAPVLLVVGALVGRLARAGVRASQVALAGVGVVTVVLLTGELLDLPGAAPDRSSAVAWAHQRDCVWGSAAELVWLDAAATDEDDGCAVFVDRFGVGLTLDPPAQIAQDDEVWAGNPRWRAAAWAQIESSDGVLLGAGEDTWFDPAQEAQFHGAFVLDETVGDVELWRRR